MDKRKIPVSDETDVPRKKANKESATKDSDVLSQRIAALKLDRVSWTELAPETKKRKVDSDNQLEVDKGGILRDRTLQATPRGNREEFEKAMAHKDATKYIKTPMQKCSDQLEVDKDRSLWERTLKVTPKVNSEEYEKAGKYTKIPGLEYSDNRLEVVKGGSLWKRPFQKTPKVNRVEYEKAGKYTKIPVVKYSDNQLVVDKDGSLAERTLEITPKENPEENEKATGHKDDKNIRNPVQKNFRKRVKNPSEALTNIKRKFLKVFKLNSNEILEKEEKGGISEMDESNKISEENISHKKLDGFKNVTSRITNFGKTKEYWLSKLKTTSETSTKCNDATLPSSSTQYPSASITQYDADSTTQTSENRSSEEVWGHFRKYLQYDIKSPDRMDTDDVNEEDMELSAEYRIHSLEYPKTAEPEAVNPDLEQYAKKTKSMYRNLNDITTEVMEYSLVKTAERTVNNNVSAYQIDSSTISTKNHPRQRIVYNTPNEIFRNWYLARIKDREILLKSAIMEGRFEEDLDKKMALIEEAEDIQYEMDALFDKVDEQDRTASYLEQSKYRQRPGRPKDHLENFQNLFQQLYKPSSFEYRCGDLVNRIDAMKCMSAYEEYMETEEKLQCLSDEVEETLMKAVDKLYSYLGECQMVRKGKMPLAGNRSLEYYQYFIGILDKAIDHNLGHLYEIISLTDDILPVPLHKHLSESYNKCVRFSRFLNEERPDVFPKRSVDNRAFFEKFCQSNFKN